MQILLPPETDYCRKEQYCHSQLVASFVECYLISKFHLHVLSLEPLFAFNTGYQAHLYAWNWQIDTSSNLVSSSLMLASAQ